MSDKTVAQKLLIKENYKVLFINEPENYKAILGDLPKNVTILSEPAKSIDFIQFFVSSNTELKKGLIEEKNELDHGGKKFENPEGGAKNGEI
jgi:predicted CoA-binding protein